MSTSDLSRNGHRDLRPDRERKDRGRRGARRPHPRRDRLRGLDAGLPTACRSSRTNPSGRPRLSLSGRSTMRALWPSISASRTRRSTSALARGRTPVVVGGTGLYLRAALAELELPPAPPPGRARALGAPLRPPRPRAGARGPRRARPAGGRRRPPNDRRRVVRALELHEAGGSLAPPRDRLWSEETRHPTLIFGLDVPKPRCSTSASRHAREAMFARGVEEEVERALAAARSRRPRARSSASARSPSCHEPRRSRRSRSRTRQYAAYQRKWMRRIPRSHAVPPNPRRPRRAPRYSPQPAQLRARTASLRCLRLAVREMARARKRLPARRAGRRSARPCEPRARAPALRLPLRRRLGRGPGGARRRRPRGPRSSSGIPTARRPSSRETEPASPPAGSLAGAAPTRSRSPSASVRFAPACAAASRSRWTWARSRSAPIEALDVNGTRPRVHAGLGRQPACRHRAATPQREELLRLGPLVENHPRFPERTNVQLVRVDSRGEATAGVWERGAGETLSSGTSAVRGRRRRGRQRLVRQPRHRPPRGRRPARRARRRPPRASHGLGAGDLHAAS